MTVEYRWLLYLKGLIHDFQNDDMVIIYERAVSDLGFLRDSVVKCINVKIKDDLDFVSSVLLWFIIWL